MIPTLTTSVLEKWLSKGFHEESLVRRQVLLEAIGKYSFESVLDIGCDEGQDLYLIKLCYPKVRIEGIDCVQEQVTKGNQKIGNYLRCLDANSLDYPDDSFDLVISDTCLYRLEDNRKVIDKMVRIASKAVIMLEVNDYMKNLPISTMKTKPELSHLWNNQGYIYEITK